MAKIAESFKEFRFNSPFAVVFNTEGLYWLLYDSSFRGAVTNSDLIYVDGIGLWILLRICGFSDCKRLHGPDLFHQLLHDTSGQRKLIIGGTDVAHIKLFRKYPQLRKSKLHYFDAGKFSENDISPVDSLIERFNPDEIYVCLGIRKQEKLGLKIREAYPDTAVVGVGASIDFESGNVLRSPLWAQKLGIEWLPRMLKEWRLFPRFYRSLKGLLIFSYFRIFNKRKISEYLGFLS